MGKYKKIILLIIITISPGLASAQAFWGQQTGLIYPLLTSDKLVSLGGIGYKEGGYTRKQIGSHFDISSEIYVSYLSYNIKGYSYQVNIANTVDPYYRVGLDYVIGMDYFIIPKKISIGVGAGIGVSVTSYTGSHMDDGLGAPPSDPTHPLILAGDFGGINFNYGAQLALLYHISTHWEVALRYYKGLNNITSGSGFNTSLDEISLACHIIITDFSIARPCHNKQLR